MPVAASTYALDGHAQADGRVWVTETHTLTVGDPVRVTWLAAPTADFAGIASARAALIDLSLAEQEADALIGSP